MNKLKKSVLALVVLALLSACCSAQSATNGCTAEEARQLMKALRAEQMATQMMGMVYKSVTDGFIQSFSKSAEITDPRVVNLLNTYMDKMGKEMMSVISVSEMMEGMVPIYQKHFSSEDVKAIIAFYESPAGKKMMDSSSAMMQEGGAVGETYMKRKQPELERLMSSYSEELKQKIAELKAEDKK
jgi:hypothetical protein